MLRTLKISKALLEAPNTISDDNFFAPGPEKNSKTFGPRFTEKTAQSRAPRRAGTRPVTTKKYKVIAGAVSATFV